MIEIMEQTIKKHIMCLIRILKCLRYSKTAYRLTWPLPVCRHKMHGPSKVIESDEGMSGLDFQTLENKPFLTLVPFWCPFLAMTVYQLILGCF